MHSRVFECCAFHVTGDVQLCIFNVPVLLENAWLEMLVSMIVVDIPATAQDPGQRGTKVIDAAKKRFHSRAARPKGVLK